MYAPGVRIADVAEVPALGTVGAVTLADAASQYENARTVISATTLTATLAAGAALLVQGQVLVVSLVVLGLLLVATLLVEVLLTNPLLVRSSSYTVSPDFVYITRGVVLRRSSLILRASLVNIETVEGPLLTRFGLAKVRFRGVTTSEVLGPVDAHQVLAIRRILLDRSCET